jgi:LysM repeat protein
MTATTALSPAPAQVQPMSPKRRARLARTLFILSAAALVVASLIGTQTAVATDQPLKVATSFNYVSVMPGDTLWLLAEKYSDGKNPQDWIFEVMLLNNLSSANLIAGERLALP